MEIRIYDKEACSDLIQILDKVNKKELSIKEKNLLLLFKNVISESNQLVLVADTINEHCFNNGCHLNNK